tara:strand:+ start:443 stop:1411 length:969 start_codon:yes stop_codon:yes gene_type:complete
VKNNQNKISKISFLLIEEFSMIAFVSALEPLRAANRISNANLFEWEILSIDNQKVFCSNGISIETQQLIEEKLQTDILFVCSGLNVKDRINKKLLGTLRKISRRGIGLGSLCTASYILAKAGLLSDKKATIHWENLSSTKEEFPDLFITNNLFEIDKEIYSSSGGTSSLDLMLHIISGNYGTSLAKNISDQLIHERIRLPNDFQRMDLRARLGVSHPKLLNAVSIMEENLEEPLSQKDLASKSNISLRQLERLFKKYISNTPNRFYLKLRLERARHLLMQTSMSILSVALASGFNSSSHFSKCYKIQFGISPRETRLYEQKA